MIEAAAMILPLRDLQRSELHVVRRAGRGPIAGNVRRADGVESQELGGDVAPAVARDDVAGEDAARPDAIHLAGGGRVVNRVRCDRSTFVSDAGEAEIAAEHGGG